MKLTKAQHRILVSARDTPGGHPIKDGRAMRVAKMLAGLRFVVLGIPTGTRTIWGDAIITDAGRAWLASQGKEGVDR